MNGRQVVPGPRGSFLFGHFPALRRDPIGLFTEATKRHGDLVRLRLGPQEAFLVTHPDAIGRVLQDNHRNYDKQTRGIKQLQEILGKGLLTNDGSFWLKQRRLIQPAFERQRIAAFATLMATHTATMLDVWQKRFVAVPDGFDLHAQMMAVTLEIVGQAMFGADVKAEAVDVSAAMNTAIDINSGRFARIFNVPLSWPTPENRRFRKALVTLDRVGASLIAARRRDDSRHDDLLSMLVALTDADTGERMDDKQLRDEVITIFLAGHETTASVLTFTCYLLAQHLAVEAKVYDEITRVIGDRDPTAEDAKNLEYTTMVIREAMRLYPPGWLFGRRLIDSDNLAGFALPGGSWLLISSFITHRRPDFWEDPESFRPDRFRPGTYEKNHNFAYFPFGGGPRLCIGQPMAMLELQLIIAMIVRRYRLRLAPGETLKLAPLITLRPKGGLRVCIDARH